MASVRRRDPKDPTSPWVCEYTDAGGTRRRITPKTGLKKDADAARKRIEAELERDEHTASRETKTVAQISEVYIRHLEDRHKLGTLAWSTLVNQRVHLKHTIIPALGARKLADITVEDVERMVATMTGEGYALSSVASRRATLGTLEQWGRERGYTKKDIVSRAVRSNPITRIERIRIPTKDEAFRILTASGQRLGRNDDRCTLANQLTVMVGLLCGLRYGEIAGLRRSDFDPVNRRLTVRLQMTSHGEHKGPKTRSGIRDVPCPKMVCRALSDWLSRFHIANERGLILTTRGGQFRSNTNWQGTWADILKKAGCYEPADPYHFHSARHFAGSLWLEKGVPLAVVSRLLGHSNPRVTLSIYTHALQHEDDTARAIEDIAASFLTGVDATQTRLPELTH